MEKTKSIEASQLPEETIQHIQSFMSGKEAARATILSKSWYTAWLTRPDLDFSEEALSDKRRFIDFGMRTMQRYLELNLKIQSFKLIIYSKDKISVAKEWTLKAMNLGATHIDIKDWDFNFVLPHEVLESESIVKLSLSGCIIELQEVNCWRLKSLLLDRVRLQGNILWDIISMCPLIEELLLSGCEESYVTPSLRSYYKSLVFIGGNDFHRLKVLFLEWVEISEEFLRDLPSKFPCLNELTLKYCAGYKEIPIYNNSFVCRVRMNLPFLLKQLQGNWRLIYIFKIQSQSFMVRRIQGTFAGVELFQD